jgi:Flp pilus assembly protein TadG
LIAAGGIAFDYSRMASMDTELQAAADQAALAAAAQLDGNANACARASAAAHAMLANRTYMANDSNASGTAVTIPDEPTCDATGQIRFYQSWDTSNGNDQPGPPATSDANAKVV